MQCDFEGLISGSIKIHERCSEDAQWGVHLPACGHQEFYCIRHKEEFWTYGRVSIVCNCGTETAGLDVAWRPL